MNENNKICRLYKCDAFRAIIIVWLYTKVETLNTVIIIIAIIPTRFASVAEKRRQSGRCVINIKILYRSEDGECNNLKKK